VITAQHFADSLNHVRIESADRGADGYDGRHADNDADERQKRPQFVGEDRLQGDLQRIGIKRKYCSHKTDPGRIRRLKTSSSVSSRGLTRINADLRLSACIRG
jgi:hypothetical protein